MGSIWGGFGTAWGLFWALLGHFWSIFWRSKTSFFQTWVQDGLQEASGIHLGVDLGGLRANLWTIWGGIWETFKPSGEIVGRFWTSLKVLGPAAAESINRTPALIREASQLCSSGRILRFSQLRAFFSFSFFNAARIERQESLTDTSSKQSCDKRHKMKNPY